MIRALVAALLLLSPLGAAAQAITTCLDMSQSYSASFYQGTTVSGMIYLVPQQYLVVSMRAASAGPYTEFINVPQSVAQQFAQTSTPGTQDQSPDTFFAQSIQPVFHEAMLNQNGCPLLNEAGNPLLTK